MQAEYAIIGGGVVGLSIAWGLLKKGRKIIVLDGGDTAFRASRGNFGLVWVQGKGLTQPAYTRWTQHSATAWPTFAARISEATGHDLALRQDGGFDYHLSEEELENKVKSYEKLREELNGNYPFEVLGPADLKREEPNIGPAVAGAILHRQDGHVNPLRLLRALSDDVRRMGGPVLTGKQVTDVDKPSGFRLTCADGSVFESEKVILSAGLGGIELGPKMGFRAPMRPQRGQVLITEKLPKLMNRPSGIIRQVDEGGVQIGNSKEEVGYDDGVTTDTITRIAARATQVFPDLARAQVVRAWGALRIMSPDGLPIYQESPEFSGAYLVTCHSGITLAAAHAMSLTDWLEGNDSAPDLEVFSEQRFAVS